MEKSRRGKKHNAAWSSSQSSAGCEKSTDECNNQASQPQPAAKAQPAAVTNEPMHLVEDTQQKLHTSNTLRAFYNQQQYCDLTLSTRGQSSRGQEQTIECHRLVMLTASEYLRQKCQSLDSNACVNVIDVSPVDIDVAREMVGFIYNGKCALRNSNIVPMLVASRQWQIALLVNNCEKYILEHINNDIAIDCLETVLSLKLGTLTDHCLKFIGKEFETLQANGKLITLSIQAFTKLLDSEYIAATEESVFLCTMSWIQTNSSAHQDVSELYKLINFHDMSVEFLGKQVLRHPLMKHSPQYEYAVDAITGLADPKLRTVKTKGRQRIKSIRTNARTLMTTGRQRIKSIRTNALVLVLHENYLKLTQHNDVWEAEWQQTNTTQLQTVQLMQAANTSAISYVQEFQNYVQVNQFYSHAQNCKYTIRNTKPFVKSSNSTDTTLNLKKSVYSTPFSAWFASSDTMYFLCQESQSGLVSLYAFNSVTNENKNIPLNNGENKCYDITGVIVGTKDCIYVLNNQQMLSIAIQDEAATMTAKALPDVLLIAGYPFNIHSYGAVLHNNQLKVFTSDSMCCYSPETQQWSCQKYRDGRLGDMVRCAVYKDRIVAYVISFQCSTSNEERNHQMFHGYDKYWLPQTGVKLMSYCEADGTWLAENINLKPYTHMFTYGNVQLYGMQA